MPAKSKKQFRFFKAAQKKGKVSKKVAAEYTEGVGYKDLPEALGEKVDKAKAKAAKRKPKRKK